jgi:hypothetical protein
MDHFGKCLCSAGHLADWERQEAEVRMVALQGCKDLRQMLEMAYGKAGKKEEKGN